MITQGVTTLDIDVSLGVFSDISPLRGSHGVDIITIKILCIEINHINNF